MIPENRIQRFLSRPDRPRAAGHPSWHIEIQRPNNGGTYGPGSVFQSSDLFFPPRVGMPGSPFTRRPSPDEIRVHAALFDRLAELRRTRRGLWSRIWGFLRGD